MVLGQSSLAVQWLGLSTFTAGGLASIPGWGAKILQVPWHILKKKKCSWCIINECSKKDLFLSFFTACKSVTNVSR